LTALGTAGIGMTELARPRVASSQDPCAEGSEITELTYLGRNPDGQHLVRASWRFREWSQDELGCSNGTRLEATFAARYVGGSLRTKTLQLRLDRQSVTAALPAVGAADLLTLRVEIMECCQSAASLAGWCVSRPTLRHRQPRVRSASERWQIGR